MRVRLRAPGKDEETKREDDGTDLHQNQSIFRSAVVVISFAHDAIDSILVDTGNSGSGEESHSWHIKVSPH